MRARTLAIAGATAAAATMLGAGFAAADPATIPGDGLYRVGVDIQPGIYQAPGTNDPNHGCFWRRLRHIQQPGDYADPNHYIIASDFTYSTPVRVLIKPTDVAFASTNCGAWIKVPPPPNTGSYGPGGQFGSEY
ncbi:hypothetical protein NDR87_21140 [Nocardia sp. CDC159]|uniref:Secreted protein n=1 Tax=Nocardia pulmonis TaxID=2951408 RepID=A0A9X2IXW9_9NOCA|nr:MULTISPECIES: hypothetical protein [Nocardia]MCM6776452.1 hypothetical protein [Nocardia pulmonis]MCM6788876.1 hypothetical protein [Nocardia sp. CDC159]